MKTKMFIFLSFCLSLSFASDKAVLDEKIKVGNLSNGFSYYIRENSYPEKKASLRLVVKVGSIYENEHEQGIAHFIEHLLFRGTKNYKDGEIEKYLESLGVWFGKDSNAYTSFDNTTYVVDLPIDNEEDFDKSLHILKEMGFYALIEDECVNKERNVVLDELNQATSSFQYKQIKKSCSCFIPDSLFSKRFPIGKKEIIETVTPETLRSFYKRWYRPDRMALVAVGDFNAKQVEEKIQKLFSDVPNPKSLVSKPQDISKVPSEPKILKYFDASIPMSSVTLLSFFENDKPQEVTISDLRKDLRNSMIVSIFNNRLVKKAHEGNFISGFAYEADFMSPKIRSLQALIIIYEDKLEVATSTLKAEIVKLLQDGVTQKECDIALSALRKNYDQAFENLDKTEHSSFVQTSIAHFLEKTPMICNEWKIGHNRSVLDSISTEEINKAIAKIDIGQISLIFSTASEKLNAKYNEDNLQDLLNEEVAFEKAIENEKEDGHKTEKYANKGRVIKTVIDHKNDVKHLTLSNGIKLLLKKTDLEKERIYINGFAKGGLTSLKKEEFDSALIAPSYRLKSGMGEISYLDLMDLTTEKNIYLNLGFGHTNRYINIQSPKNEQEMVFKLLYKVFEESSFDETQWDAEVARVGEYINQCKRNPDYLFYYFLIGKNTQNNYLFKIMDIKNLNKDLCQKIYNENFRNINDFTFTIVGDFDEDKIIDHIESFVASLPSDKRGLSANTSIPSFLPSEDIQAEFKAGDKTYVTTCLSKPCNMEASAYEYDYEIDALCKILQTRLYESVRKKLGSTYGVSVGCSSYLGFDEKNKMLQIQFTSQEKDRDGMIAVIKEEVELLKNIAPTSREIDTVKKLFLETLKQSALKNAYWCDLLFRSEFLGLPLDRLTSYETRIEALNAESLLEVAKILLCSPIYSQISHYPEK